MKSSAKKIELASVDDLFSTEEGRQDAKLEKIQEIPLSELHPFKNHPFKVKMICSPPKKAARMQSWKRFRKFRCLNCIRSRTTHSKSRMTKP